MQAKVIKETRRLGHVAHTRALRIKNNYKTTHTGIITVQYTPIDIMLLHPEGKKKNYRYRSLSSRGCFLGSLDIPPTIWMMDFSF